MGFFSKGIKQGMASGALGGIIEQVPTAEGAANAANARKKKEQMDQQESIASINLDRLNQARLDSKTMVADQLASRESHLASRLLSAHKSSVDVKALTHKVGQKVFSELVDSSDQAEIKLSLQQSLYKSKIGTVV